MPWYVPPEVADAPDDTGGGYRYDAEGFYTGEVPVQLLECEPHAPKGSDVATSIRCVFGADAPNGEAIRWDEYLGLDMTKAFSVTQQKGFLSTFAPGYLGSADHRAGHPCHLEQLPGRWALLVLKKEVDTYEGRPPRNRPRVSKWLRALEGPTALDPSKVRAASVAIEQVAGAPRAAAPGARPPRAAGAVGTAQGQAPRPGGIPPRPSPPPTQRSLMSPPPSTSAEDADLPF